MKNIKFDFEKPVSILTGHEFFPVEGISFAQQVLNFFNEQGEIAKSPWGEVLFDYIRNSV